MRRVALARRNPRRHRRMERSCEAVLSHAVEGSPFVVDPTHDAARLIDTVGGLVTEQKGLSALVFVAIIAGIVVCRRRDATLATVLMCCFVVPVGLAALLGLRAPVLLDRTPDRRRVGAAATPALYAVDAIARRTQPGITSRSPSRCWRCSRRPP